MTSEPEPEKVEIKHQEEFEKKAERFKIDKHSPLFLWVKIYNKQTNIELKDEGINLVEWNPVTKKGIKGTIENHDFKKEPVHLPNTYTLFQLRQTGDHSHLIDFIQEMQNFIGQKDIKLITTRF